MTATEPTDPPAESCCVCGGGPVTYRNYREQPFCWPCADCQCNENLCVRTGVNDPAVSATAEPSDPTQCSGEEGFCPEHGFHRQSLKQPAAGYCPHCGRGDAGPTAAGYEQLRQRAEKAEAALNRLGALTGAHKDSDQITIGELTTILEPPQETS